MALTATATQSLCASTVSLLGNAWTISPFKVHIMYAVEPFESLEQSFDPFVERLRSKRSNMPLTIIYCLSYTDCADLYIYFQQMLSTMFTESQGPFVILYCQHVNKHNRPRCQRVHIILVSKDRSSPATKISRLCSCPYSEMVACVPLIHFWWNLWHQIDQEQGQ